LGNPRDSGVQVSGKGPDNYNPASLPRPIGFAHATRSGSHVYVGGQIGCDEKGRIPEPTDLVAQFTRAIANLAAALDEAGASPSQVVKLTYYVADLGAYRASLGPIGEAYRAVFGRHYPAAALIGVAELFDPDALVEIECIAVVSEV
jgi:enamine deaminase RidA (YjgF/YER057c/UK114 family)